MNRTTTRTITIAAKPARGALAALSAALLLLAIAWAGPARALDDDIYARLARRSADIDRELENLIREMDAPGSYSDTPSRSLSIRRNAAVTIGGELRVSYVGSRANLVNPSFGVGNFGLPGRSRMGDFKTSAANLVFDARAGDRWRARLDINLNGYSGFNQATRTVNPNSPGQPLSDNYRRESLGHNINEAYVQLLKAGHSGFGFKAGVLELPFGLRSRPDLIGQSFVDAPDLAGSYLMDPVGRDHGVRLPHASRLLEPVPALQASYEMRDIIRFEAGIFQDRDGKRAYARDSGGIRRYRTDTEAPLSWQVGFSILPLEGWELSADFRNRHSRSRGVHYWADSPFRTDFLHNLASGASNPSWDGALGQWSDAGGGAGFGARSNEQAFAIGLAVEIPGTELTVRAEYAHGWNQGFNKYINSDNVNVGLAYRLTPRLTLHGQAEWLFVRDKSWLVPQGGGWGRDSRNNQLYRFLVGAEYELARGLTVEAGWQYEYWKAVSALGGLGTGRETRVNTAHMAYTGIRFLF